MRLTNVRSRAIHDGQKSIPLPPPQNLAAVDHAAAGSNSAWQSAFSKTTSGNYTVFSVRAMNVQGCYRHTSRTKEIRVGCQANRLSVMLGGTSPRLIDGAGSSHPSPTISFIFACARCSRES